MVYDIYGEGDAVTQFRIDADTGVITLAVSQLNNDVSSYVVSLVFSTSVDVNVIK